MPKNKRNEDIIRIIKSRNIANQEELLDELRALGHELTQATLSRNLKELGVGRIPDSEKGYIYFIPNRLSNDERVRVGVNVPKGSIVSFEFTYNLGVLRTIPGFANSVAIMIDLSGSQEIAGTIAGDDTILIIPREPFEREDVERVIQRVLADAF